MRIQTALYEQVFGRDVRTSLSTRATSFIAALSIQNVAVMQYFSLLDEFTGKSDMDL